LLTGDGSPAQTGHNDFSHTRGDNVGYFCIATGKEGASIWICESSHKFAFYEEDKKRQLADILKMEKISIPANSVFFGHGYVQHAGAEWGGNHCLRYHMYFIPEDHPLMDDVSFAFGWSLQKDGYTGAAVKSGKQPVPPKTSKKVVEDDDEENDDDDATPDDENEKVDEGSTIITVVSPVIRDE